VVCIHPSCWKKGYWVEAFESRGFRLVVGANPWDRNALERIRYLLSSFEYMVTNSFGSQIAYAAYFGAKPSVYGPYAHYSEADFQNAPLYRLNPRLPPHVLKAISEAELRRHHPQLFCHPREAKAGVEWGRFEVGEANKVPPRRMRSLFGWDPISRARRWVYSKARGRLRHRIRMYADPAYRETLRLQTLPPYQPTRTSLLGPSIEVQSAHQFLERKRELFDQELYRFLADGDSPRILDCGAGIGLGVCYFKKLYPQSEITAFEPDPQIFEILKRNCESWGAKDV